MVGQLHGGGAACGNNAPDWYGWFHISWTGGGTSDSRLSDWLDPLGTGAETLETIDVSRPGFRVTPSEGLESSGVRGGPFEPAEKVFTLENTGVADVHFTASVTESWVTVTPGSGLVPVGGTVEVTVGYSSSAENNSVGRHQAGLNIVNTDFGAGSTSRPITLNVLANVPTITGVVPNPFGSGAYTITEIRYTLGGATTVTARIHNIRGGMVKDLGSMAGVAGENRFIWDGTGQGGSRMASGSYVLVLEAAGHEERTSIMLIH